MATTTSIVIDVEINANKTSLSAFLNAVCPFLYDSQLFFYA